MLLRMTRSEPQGGWEARPLWACAPQKAGGLGGQHGHLTLSWRGGRSNAGRVTQPDRRQQGKLQLLGPSCPSVPQGS